jgi:predicted transcriptional regulator YheO
MDDFIKSVIQTIFKNWTKLSSSKKDKIRNELNKIIVVICIAMDDFIKSVIQTILKEWDELSLCQKDKLRNELINTFISFVGEGEQRDKNVIGIH